jgi:proliferating cell nuclear antigen
MSEQELNMLPQFDIKVYGTEELKTFTALSQCLTDEMCIKIDQEGLSFRSMDPSHVCLIDVSYPNTMFEKYQVSKEGMFGIRTKELNKLVKTFDKKESVNISLNESLKLETKSSGQTIQTIESSNVDCPLPKLSYNSMVTIELKEFKNIIKRLRSISAEYITLNMHDQKLEISSKSYGQDSKTILEKGMVSIREFDLKEASEATYSLEWLETFLKCLKCELITLNFSSKMPMKIQAHDSNYSKIFFYLAPRVSD